MARLAAQRMKDRAPLRRGHVCLFRLAGDAQANDDETWVDNDSLVEIEGDAEQPDAYTKFVAMKQTTRRFDTTNPAPYEEATARPDTGYHGTMLELTFVFLETARAQIQNLRGETQPDFTGQSNRAGAIARLRDWEREDNSIRGKFRNGRIGFRCDYRPEFNLRPDNQGGYKIISFETFSNLEVPWQTTGHLVIQYSGYPGLAPGESATARERLGNYTARQTSLARLAIDER